MEIKLNPRGLTLLLAWITVALLFLNVLSCAPVFMGTGDPYAWLNVDFEHNLPTLFSSLLLICCSALAFLIALTRREKLGDFLAWLGLAVVFLFICSDEFMCIHEQLSDPLRGMFHAASAFYYAWVIPYALLLVAFALLYAPFVSRLPRDTRKNLILATVLYVLGGIGFELVGGAWYEAGGKNAGFYVLATFEEGLEMAGCVAFIHTFTTHLDRYASNLRLRITSE